MVAPVEGRTRFHDLGLPDEVMHGIADLGFEYCTPIQAAVLTESISGRNVTGQAQTGTGKTAAFLIAVFAQCLRKPLADTVPGRPRALILAPTRELVVQIASDAKALGAYLPFACTAVYGGMDFDKQAAQLTSGSVTIVAATPGRLLDFAKRRMIDLSQVEFLIIDEADRMLDMGFIPDVRRIVMMTPPREQRQTLFFSATMTDDVNRLAAQWVPDPVRVEIAPEQVAVDTVEQIVYIVRAEDKLKVLYNLIRQGGLKLLVFGNRRDATERVYALLTRLGVHCELLSGAVNQKKRMRVLEDFKAGRVDVVVATDVAGRGIHVDSIDYVVNFDLPYEPADYVHRIGRTGRAGASGKAVSFACEDESFIIPDIEKYIGRELPCRQPDETLLADLPRMGPPIPRLKPEGDSQRRSGARSGGGGGRSGRRPGGSSGGGRRRPRS